MRLAVLFTITFVAIVMMVTVSEACDCNYHSGGCVISRVASPGHACKCRYRGAWTCGGNSIGCDSRHRLCKNPDKSREACNLGNGDCGGY